MGLETQLSRVLVTYNNKRLQYIYIIMGFMVFAGFKGPIQTVEHFGDTIS